MMLRMSMGGSDHLPSGENDSLPSILQRKKKTFPLIHLHLHFKYNIQRYKQTKIKASLHNNAHSITEITLSFKEADPVTFPSLEVQSLGAPREFNN